MEELLSKNTALIINSDVDGLISGLLLSTFFKGNIVGFTNSSDRIWLYPDAYPKPESSMFVDMFVAYPQWQCIDQHIVSIDAKHGNYWKTLDHKINPNIIRDRVWKPTQSYIYKYPFGTCHFLLAILLKMGMPFPSQLYENTQYGISGFDVFCRADDAMQTSLNSPYTENAKDWWKWLLEFSGNHPDMKKMIVHLYSIDKEKSITIKQKMTQVFKEVYQSDTADGGFKSLYDTTGNVRTGFLNCIEFIAQILGLPSIVLPNNFTEIVGNHKRIRLSMEQEKELYETGCILNESVFSYAFVYSQNKDKHLSYTVLHHNHYFK